MMDGKNLVKRFELALEKFHGAYADPYADAEDRGDARRALKKAREALIAAIAEPPKLWLWKNFVDGKPEYWAFDNPFPIHMDNGDPQTLGEPCGYAIVKPSRQGRTDVTEEQVIARIRAAR